MTDYSKSTDGHDAVATFPLTFLRDFVQAVPNSEADVDEQLRRSGISPALMGDQRSRATTAQASKVIRTLWRTTGDELLGLGRNPMRRGTFRMVTLGLVHTDDMESALGRFCEFGHLLDSLPTMAYEVDGDTVRVSMDLRSAGLDDPLPALLLVAFVQRFASWLILRRIDASLVELPHAEPADLANHNLVFQAPLRFGADQGVLHFDASLLDAPVMQDEESLEAFLAYSPQVWLARRDFGTTIEDRVRRVLYRGLASEWPDQAELARSMAMSPQTLRRRLREQGTSVTEIKESIQRDAAIVSLIDGDETVADLATRLGFSEASAFHRAFRRWTGQSPGAYRSNGNGSGDG